MTSESQVTVSDDLGRWREAALLKDRTRRAIRERHRAGETVEALADDYGVPVRFVSALVAWQLFQDDDEC